VMLIAFSDAHLLFPAGDAGDAGAACAAGVLDSFIYGRRC